MAPTTTKLRPPRHLLAATRRWWLEVINTWALEAHHVKLLTLAAEAWDRCQQARALVDKEGLMTTTKAGGPRIHPAVRIEQDSRLAFARLIRELDLDVAPPREAARPSPLRSVAGRRA